MKNVTPKVARIGQTQERWSPITGVYRCCGNLSDRRKSHGDDQIGIAVAMYLLVRISLTLCFIITYLATY